MENNHQLRLGEYEHYKGGRYRVLGIARHSETKEDLVVYEALQDNPLSKLWVRPLKMFLEDVEINSHKVPRFRYMGDKN